MLFGFTIHACEDIRATRLGVKTHMYRLHRLLRAPFHWLECYVCAAMHEEPKIFLKTL